MNYKPKKGEKNPNAKLNWEKVREIRRMAEKGVEKKDMVPVYGVSLRTVSAVIKGEYWREDGSSYMTSRFKW